MVVFLTQRGLHLLKSQGREASQLPRFWLQNRNLPSQATLDHEMQVLDVKAAFYAAVRTNSNIGIREFSTCPRLHQFRARKAGQFGDLVAVKPDGFLRLTNSFPKCEEHTFFLELDRSTETQETLALRLGSYLDHYKSGGFARQHGAPASAYKQYAFRVLVVFKTAERRNNTVERLLGLNPPVLTQAWLSTFDEVIADPLGSIWLRPLDYLAAVKDSSFDPSGKQKVGEYERSSLREVFIEQNVIKRNLLSHAASLGSFTGGPRGNVRQS